MSNRIAVWMVMACLLAGGARAATVGELRCAYMKDPLGIDAAKPRLGWIMASEVRGEVQRAYHVLVAATPELLAKDQGDLWDSGKVVSDQSLQVEYAGKPLVSQAHCWWKVRVWDKNDQAGPWSTPGQWTMGLLRLEDWKAQWIGATANAAAAGTTGYHAAEARQADQAKWVQVDLGRPVHIDAVKLHAMDHAGKPGFGFPIRFSISAAEDANFAGATLLADQTAADYPNPGHRAVNFAAPGVTARYVRVTATKLWDRHTGAEPFCFALAALEVLSGDKNVALHAKVTAQDSCEFGEWGKVHLTDGRNLAPDGAAPQNGYTSTALPIFRHAFAVAKPVAQATLYACGLGQAEFHLNGQKVGAGLLEPGWTNYRKTCLYQTYDVTKMLQPGANALGVMLGNGMYNVAGGRYTKFTGSFGPPKLIAQLQVDYADGTSDLIATDERWKLSPGPITFSCIYGGEDYDARQEQPGWDQPGFADAAWQPALVVQGPGGRLAGTSEAAPPILPMQVFAPAHKARLKPGVWVYDLGQNCSLLPRITVAGPAGARVTIITGEKFQGDHFVGACDRLASYNYVLKGAGDETWTPRFTYVGARYLQVEGAEDASAAVAGTPVIKDIAGVFVCSSSTTVGEFACSNDIFTRTAGIIDWAMRSNMMSILTDCPHRERLGWLEQVHLAGPSLMYRYDLGALFSKMSNDMAEAQLDNGLVPDIAPEYVVFGGGFRDSPEWGSACVLVPWQTYQFYGDVAILRANYAMMQRYVAYLGTTAKDHIVSHGLGDWYDLGPRSPGEAQLTPKKLTATAFYYRDIIVLRDAAQLLDRPQDVQQYTALAQEVAGAFNKDMYDAATHKYATGSQVANALPLVLGLAPEGDRAALVDNIVQDIQARGNALSAGDVGYRYLLRALADNGRSDTVFTMNQGSNHPGYGMILAKGNTSLPEPWNGGNGASSNHFMLGHIMEWFYHDLAGIGCDPAGPGFKKIIIAPTVVGDITWVKAHYDSIHGRIVSEWKREGGTLTMNVTIPANTTATVNVPCGAGAKVTESGSPAESAPGVKLVSSAKGLAVYEVGSGTYAFVAK